MDSFNPTPPWVEESMNSTWGVLEIWGFPLVFGAAAFLYLAPQVTKSVNNIKAAEYETASPIDAGAAAARERMQQRLSEDSEVAYKKLKEEEEERRKKKLEELKNVGRTLSSRTFAGSSVGLRLRRAPKERCGRKEWTTARSWDRAAVAGEAVRAAPHVRLLSQTMLK
jgi:hypothetical protein